jgi:5-dehydro-2-deoxygluconokinase
VRKLFVIAFDHRNSFMTGFLGLNRPPTDRDRVLASTAKMLIFEALEAELERAALPDGEPAILVDPRYGKDVVKRARDAGIKCSIPVERSGQDELAFETTPFYRDIEDLEPDLAKVLIRYNPEGDRGLNQRQRERILELQEYCRSFGVALIVELLVPPTQDQVSALEGESPDYGHGYGYDYDTDLRPALSVQAVDELVTSGIDPDLWKLEGVSTAQEFSLLASSACGSSQRDCGCLVLGRGADIDVVQRWVTAAASVDRYVGFAVGRTLWWEPLALWMSRDIDAAAAKRAIGENYRSLVDLYLEAERAN